eukprot:m.152028 g.152028  ORF g.152028 m.152028 type:complete len:1363 (+) comp17429_c0_seq5:284-4372(+)
MEDDDVSADMLTSIFGDEPQQYSTASGTVTSSGTKKPDGPPDPRPASGLAGLDNQGTTCYLNSLLQTMCYTPGFREQVLAIAPEALGVDDGRVSASTRKIPYELQKLLGRMVALDQCSLSTAELTTSFGWKHRDAVVQHDVSELNRIFFDALQKSLAHTPGEGLIDSLYTGCFCNLVQCLQCGTVSERVESFHDLTVPLYGVDSLEQCLQRYTEMELLEGDNRYSCSNCDTLVDAYKGLRLRTLPTILTLSLNRFTYDWDRDVRVKDNSKVEFPLELNMAPYCTEDQDRSDDVFMLYSVVIHSGAAHGGHYHAYIRDVYGEGVWTDPKDNEPEAKSDLLDCTAPEELLKALLRELAAQGQVMVTIADLCKAMQARTGRSWNRGFKKQHGAIRTFLKEHGEVFTFKDEVVGLVPGAANKDVAKENNGGNNKATEATTTPGPENSSAASDGGATAAAAATTPSPRGLESRWFDFNDSRVKGISASAIAKQFQGKESAYMLFYCRKSAFAAAGGQGPPPLPAWLAADIAQANLALAEDRRVHDLEVNKVTLKVHFASQLQLDDCVVTPRGSTKEYTGTTFECDRRTTVGDVKAMLAAMDDDDALTSPNAGLHLNFFESVGEGTDCEFHVMDGVGDVAATLQACGVVDGSELLLWDGTLSGRVNVPTGKASKPMPLKASLAAQPGQPPVEAQVYARATDTVLQLRGKLVAAFGSDQPPEALLLSQLVRTQNAWGNKGVGKARALPPSYNATTLADLKVAAGTQFVVSVVGADLDAAIRQDQGSEAAGKGQPSSSPSSAPPPRSAAEMAQLELERLSLLFPLTVTNLCAPNDPPPSGVTVQGTAKQTVAEFKDQVLQACLPAAASTDQPPDPKQYRLRTVSDDANDVRLLVPERAKLADVGLSPGDAIALERGTLPDPDTDIVLRARLGPKARAAVSESNTAALSTSYVNAFVDRQTTIADCTLLLAAMLGLEGTNWHLRKTNWCGEPGEVINDLLAPLRNTGLNNHERLVVEPGAVLPKGHFKVHVWRPMGPGEEADAADAAQAQQLPPTESKSEGDGNGDGEPKDASEKPKLKVLQSPLGERTVLVAVDDIQVPGAQKLAEFRSVVAALPGLLVPTGHAVQLREVANGRVGRVLSRDGAELKKLKFHSEMHVCATVVPEAAMHDPTTILLRVTRRVCGQCLPSQEVAFPAGSDPTLGLLKTCLAGVCDGLEPEFMQLAKHRPAKCSWFVLGTTPKGPVVAKRGKRSKKSAAKENRARAQALNIRNPPTQLKDGDLLAVRDVREQEKDDFLTDWDRDMLALRQAEIDAKREQRSGGGGSGGKHQRRPEVALQIFVPSFDSDEEAAAGFDDDSDDDGHAAASNSTTA